MPKAIDKKQSYLDYLIYGLLIIFAFNLSFVFTETSPESTWKETLNFASINNLIWGKDIIFTYGPWHMTVTRQYHPDFYLIFLFSQIYIWLVFGWFFWKDYFNSQDKKPLLIKFFVLFILLPFYMLEVFYFAIGFILFIKGTSQNIRDRLTTIFFILLSGFITLSKISLFPAFLGLMLLADTYQLFNHRKIPLYTIALCTSVLSFWLVSGHELSSLLPYIQSVKPIVSEYSTSMQLVTGGFGYIALFINYAFCLLLLKNIYTPSNTKNACSPLLNKLNLLIIFTASTFYFYLSYKAGFTRFDTSHMALFLGCTAFLTMFLILIDDNFSGFLKNARNKTNFKRFCIFNLILLILYSVLSINSQSFNKHNPIYLVHLFSPKLLKTNYDEHQNNVRKEAKIKLGEISVSDIKGSVDFYHIQQADSLSLGLDYNPRPVIKTYSAYSPTLQMANLAHLEKTDAPQSLFLNIQPIDSRFPTLTLGPSMLKIIENYEYKDTTDYGLLLEKRETPLNSITTSTTKIKVADVFQEAIEYTLEDDNNIMFMSVDIKMSILGKLFASLFKGPLIHIEITDNGNSIKERFVPNAAKTGFMISPYLPTTYKAYNMFNKIKDGDDFNHPQNRKIRFHIPKIFGWIYEKKANIKFTSYKLENKNK